MRVSVNSTYHKPGFTSQIGVSCARQVSSAKDHARSVSKMQVEPTQLLREHGESHRHMAKRNWYQSIEIYILPILHQSHFKT